MPFESLYTYKFSFIDIRFKAEFIALSVKKPCYYKGLGINKGSYVRIGDSDEHMTEYEIYYLYSYRDNIQEDLRPVERADLSDFKQEKLQKYIESIKESKPNLARFSDEKILALNGIIDSKNSDGKRTDIPHYPMKALREAIINALIHRDYSKHREGSYVYVQIYDDRIQIISPGSLYGGIKPSDLGTEKMLEARNKTIVRILEETTDLVENRHTGIETMREEIKNMNLQEPEFIADNRDFTVIFRKENKNDIVQKTTQKTLLNDAQLNILKLVRQNPSITQKEMSEKLKITRDGVKYNIAILKNNNFIERIGSDRKGYWKIIDE